MKGEFYRMDYEAWDEGTDELTLEQEAAYLRLCNQMYRRKGPIPNQVHTLCRIWKGCHPNKAKTMLRQLVDAGKIEVTPDGHLTNTRVRQELDHRETVSRQRADAGRTGGTRSADGRKKANDFNAGPEANASTPVNQNQAEKRREEENRKEDRREDEIGIPPAPWEQADAPSEPESEYAFQEGVIKLSKKDFDSLSKRYPHIDVISELSPGLAKWCADQAGKPGGSWYHAMHGALGKANKTAKDRKEELKIRAEAEANKPVKPFKRALV